MVGGLFADEMPPGLVYVRDWLSLADQSEIVADIDKRPFGTQLARRVQHYGFRYDYIDSSVQQQGSAPPIPSKIASLARRLVDERHFVEIPNQVIVNEYLSDQGIGAHVDRVSFGPEVATISLLESWPMTFKNREGLALDVLLEVGSLVLMTGAARYEWTHQIRPRKHDTHTGVKVQRIRRLSLTFRTVDVQQRVT
jgi:alkylated DNA repair dioxygenase AlkB